MNWNNGHLSDISDIFRTFIGHMTKAQNLSPKETLVNYKYKKLQINADKCRYLHVTYFIKSTHRKGHEERKAPRYKSLNSEEIIRTGTRISRINRNLSLRGIGHALHALLLIIGRIYTDPCPSIFSQFIFREHIENHENYSH